MKPSFVLLGLQTLQRLFDSLTDLESDAERIERQFAKSDRFRGFGAFGIIVPLIAGLALNLLATLLFPQPKQNQNLGKLDQPESNFGSPIASGRGFFRVTGQLIWAKDIQRVEERQRRGKGFGGGKGGGTVEKAFGTFAILFCEGEIAKIHRIWMNGELWANTLTCTENGTLSDSQDKINKYVRFYPGTETQMPSDIIQAHNGIQWTPAYRGFCYVVFNNLPLEEFGNRFPTVSVEVEHAKKFNVGAYVEDLCKSAGLLPSEYDASELQCLGDYGFVTTDVSEHRTPIEEMQLFFGFNVVETDKIYFRQINNKYAVGVSATDLASHQWGSDRPERFKRTQLNPEQIPSEVRTKYYNAKINYRDDEAYYRMPSVNNFPDRVINRNTVSIVTETWKAIRSSRNILALSSKRGDKYIVNVPIHYLGPTDPGEIIWVNLEDNTAQPLEIHKRIVGANWLIQLECTAYGGVTGIAPETGYIPTYLPQPDFITLDDNAVDVEIPQVEAHSGANPVPGLPGGGAGTPPGGNVVQSGITQLRVLDIPLFRDEHTEPGVYLGGYGTSSGWQSASVFMSRNGGVDWEAINTLTSYSIIGRATSVLPDFTGTGDDITSTLTVVLESPGELETVSQGDFDRGVNVALLGSEIIWFRDAVLAGPKTYTLDTFKRGRRNTEASRAGHVVNERFVLLSSYGERVQLRTTDIGQSLQFVAITGNQQIDDMVPVTLVYSGQDLECYAPVSLAGTKDQGGNITLTATRRDRRAGDRTDYAAFPMSEVGERYEIEIRNAANTATVRTLTSATPTVSYPAAQQVTDFGAVVAGSLTVRWYQMSALVARGTMAQSVLTLSTVAAAPVITDFSPRSGAIGDTIRVYGNGFTGGTALKIGTVATTGLAVVSDTEATGVVAASTNTGKVSLITPAGTAVSAADFVVTISVSGTSYTDEQAQDAGASMITSGVHSGIVATYGVAQDNSNRLDLSVQLPTAGFFYWSGTALQPVTIGAGLQLVGGVLSATGGSTTSQVPTSGLMLWLDSQRSLTLVSGELSTWGDNSPAGFIFTDAGVATRRPAVQNNIFGSVPGVYFDGSSDLLKSPGPGSEFNFLHSAQSTIFLVYRSQDSSMGNGPIVIHNNQLASANVGFALYTYSRQASTDTLSIFITRGVNASPVIDVRLPGVPTQQNVLMEFQIDCTASTNTVVARVNNGADSFYSRAAGPSTGNAATSMEIGAATAYAGFYCGPAWYGELLIYSRILNATELGQVRQMLTSKYGI